MSVTVALARDTMLGRSVAAELEHVEPGSLVSPPLAHLTRAADLFVLNLECCVSERGTPWPDPNKPFFFRAPPIAVRLLSHLGVSCVTLADNHALDFGEEVSPTTIWSGESRTGCSTASGRSAQTPFSSRLTGGRT